MMAIIGNLLVRMKADNRQFTRGMRGAQKEVRKFGRSVGLAKQQWKTFSRGMLRMAGIGGGIYGLTRGLKGAVDAAMRQEKADRMLAAALEGVRKGASRALPELKRFASRLQEVTIYGDEAIEEVMAQLVNLGGLTGPRLREATKATIGLATALKRDLNTAALLVARAARGNTELLAKYGLQIDKALSPQERFNQLLREGAKAFRLAEAEAQTAAGTWDQLRNTWGDLKEQVGGFLVNVARLPQVMKTTTEALKAIQDLAAGKGVGGVPLNIKEGFVGKTPGEAAGQVVAARLLGYYGQQIAKGLEPWAQRVPRPLRGAVWDLLPSRQKQQLYKPISAKVRGRIPHPVVEPSPIDPYAAREAWMAGGGGRAARREMGFRAYEARAPAATDKQDEIVTELRKIRMALVE